MASHVEFMSFSTVKKKNDSSLKIFDVTKYKFSTGEDMKHAIRSKVPNLQLRSEVLTDDDITFYEPPSRRSSSSSRKDKFAFENPFPLIMSDNEEETEFYLRIIEMEKLKRKTICSDKRRRQSMTHFRKTMSYHAARRTSLESCEDNENGGGGGTNQRHPADIPAFSYDSFARVKGPEADEESSDTSSDISKLIERVLKLHPKKPRKPRSFYIPRRRIGGAIAVRKPQKRGGLQDGSSRGSVVMTRKTVQDFSAIKREQIESLQLPPHVSFTKEEMELLSSEANCRKIRGEVRGSPKKIQGDVQDMHIMKHGARKRSKSVKRRTAVINVAAKA